MLFSAILAHGFVPDDFGSGIIVPVVKDKTGIINSVDNYKPITSTPVVSKLFEGVLLRMYENCLTSDELQFGFKSGLSCCDAIFSLRVTVDHFISDGSSVFVATLDISKAFDSINHPKLIQSLLKAGVSTLSKCCGQLV